MHTKLFYTILIGILASLALAACNGLLPDVPEPEDTGALYTQAAETVIARLTLDAGQTAIARLTEIAAGEDSTPPMASPTMPVESPPPATATPTDTPPPTPTDTPPPPPTDTPTPPPTDTPTPTITPTPIPCDWASFVRDVQISDGNIIKGGTTFTKIWRLQNIGSCTWTRDYALVFVSGNQMDAPSRVWLDTQVRPGETVDVSVEMRAPLQAGDYTGYWQLRNANGVNFGIGTNAQQVFWVKIRVAEPSDMVFNLIENYCSAEWRNRVELVTCPGQLTDVESGFVLVQAEPVLENGVKENEPAIVVRPDNSDGGTIQGRFPPFKVQAGDRFRTVIGCMDNSPGCSVVFQLNYRADGGSVQTLGNWTEVFDRSITKLDIDLAPLAGKSVEFILTVYNNGNSVDDNVFWLLPRVMR
ncbi:MAG: NBR1-Ig-like domain-containing protein [Anaerolineales bacterium]